LVWEIGERGTRKRTKEGKESKLQRIDEEGEKYSGGSLLNGFGGK
jgi:hypothetical protein